MSEPETKHCFSSIQSFLERTAFAVRFYSRLPLPPFPWEKSPYDMPSFGQIILWLPAAAFTIAIPGTLVLALALWVGLSPWIAAALAIASTTLATGAFHEDGLADVADGWGGGYTLERRLSIMGDSLLGSFGVCALILNFTLRIGGLAAIITHTSIPGACAALLIAAIISRVSTLYIIVYIPPVTLPEATYTAETFKPSLYLGSLSIAFAACVLLGFYFFSFTGLLLVLILQLLFSYLFGRLSLKMISGQTGDVAGAAEQISEIICFLVLSLFCL